MSIRKLSSLLLGAGAAAAIAGSAQAQETQTQDTSRTADTAATQRAQSDTMKQDTTQWGYQSDSAAVQNPPGYRGMERDTTIVPPGATGDDVPAGQVEDRATGTYDNKEWQDTTAEVQNPAGYRGMERPTGADTAAAGGAGQRGENQAANQDEIDRYTQRLGEMGYKVVKMTKAEKKAWSKKSGKDKERSTGMDKAKDTTRVGDTQADRPADAEPRMESEKSDTSSTVRAGRDTTADTTRFGENAEEFKSDTTSQ